MAEVLAALVRANLAAGLAILLVLALRKSAGRIFGPAAAYRLWAIPPLVALASLLPARAVDALDVAGAATPGFVQSVTAAVPASGGLAPLVLSLWAAGVLASLGLLVRAQLRFLRRVARGRAGPAVVGFAWPRMVTPADYEQRFTAEERQVVRAHERVHIERHDPRTNAFIALMQAVNWFNPLVHAAAAHARLDQELACDAAVVGRFPTARRRGGVHRGACDACEIGRRYADLRRAPRRSSWRWRSSAR